MTNLYLDQDLKPTFEKVAMPVKLSDNPDNWQREIASEIFKQVPYLADYSVNVMLDRVDQQRGYAFGSAEVANKTDSPIPDQPQAAVHIPIIVKDRLMQPLDVMLDGKEALPLNEHRLREKLFRTAAMETSTRKPTDQGMVDQLYPPMRTNYGYGNAVSTGVGVGGMGKQASVSLCHAISSTISDPQFDALMKKIAEDETSLLVRRNPFVQTALADLTKETYASAEKTASALVRSIKPTVVQITKLASGNFKVKWANAGAFAPQEAQANPGQAGAMAGQDLSQMQPGQTLTVTTQRAQKQGLDEADATVIKEFGDYAVKNADTGETLVGTVLPVVDFQMQPLELFVFTDGGAHYATQDEITGIRQEGPGGMGLQQPEPGPEEMGGAPPAGDPSMQAAPTPDAGMPKMAAGAQPDGDGVFVYMPQGGGKPFCTVPITISAATQGPDGSSQLMASDVFGGQLTLVMTPGLSSFEPLDEDGTIAIPDDMQWVPLSGEAVHLAKSDTPDAPQDLKDLGGEVAVKSTGAGETSLEGMPLAKVARDQRWFLKEAEATFMLCAMGLSQVEAREVIKEAETRPTHQVKLAGLRPITPLSDVHATMEKRAMALLQQFDYGFWKRDLVKEAAALEDSETADKVLAMNFINPENLSIFASYLPDLDNTSTKLAEMLLASRLGMSQVPTGAAERAMKNMEEVIEGLRSLQQKELV